MKPFDRGGKRDEYGKSKKSGNRKRDAKDLCSDRGKNRAGNFRKCQGSQWEANPDVVEWRADWYTEVFRWECVEYMLQSLREILGEIPLLFTFRTRQEGGEQAIALSVYQELNETGSRYETGRSD